MDSIKYLKSKAIKFRTIHLDGTPRTAKDVERIYGCPLNRILKTLVFTGEKESMMVIAPGDKRVDVNKLKKITKQDNIRIAKPNEVEEITGHKIGDVTPFGIERNIKKIIDESVFKNQIVNIGSGKAEIGIELNSEELKKALDMFIADIIE